MNKQEAQQRIDTLRSEIDKLEKIINTPGKTAGERFWELVSGTTVRFNFETYPNRIFGFRDDEYVWEYDFKNNYLWLRYSTVWSVLEKEYDLDYSEIQSIVKNEVEEHFKRKGVTPLSAFEQRARRVGRTFQMQGGNT